MADNADKPARRYHIGGWKFALAVILILSYCATSTYGIMSDTSIRGLTVKMFNITRSCMTNPSTSLKALNYTVQGSIWSTSSLKTSLSHLSLTLSVDGLVLGTTTQTDGSFGPSQSMSFNIVFTHPTLDPTVLPLSSRLVLTLTSTVAAGLYSSTGAAADSTIQAFTSSSC